MAVDFNILLLGIIIRALDGAILMTLERELLMTHVCAGYVLGFCPLSYTTSFVTKTSCFHGDQTRLYTIIIICICAFCNQMECLQYSYWVSYKTLIKDVWTLIFVHMYSVIIPKYSPCIEHTKDPPPPPPPRASFLCTGSYYCLCCLSLTPMPYVD